MTEELFNVYTACEALKINKEIYLRIVQKAIAQTDNDIKSLMQAYEENDIENVQAIAHRLKGDYGNLRIDRLFQIAKELNDLAKGSYDQQRAGQLVSEFAQTYEQVKQCIESYS